MKQILFVFLMVFQISVLAQTNTQATPPTSTKQNILIHLSKGTNDLRASVMAFRIGKLMQEKAQVTMFLDQDGGRWADSKQNLNLTWGTTKIEDLIKDYLKAGGQIIVCPVCVDENGGDKKAPRAGFQIGTPESIANLFLKADKILDY